MLPKGNVFESIDPRRHVLSVNELRLGKVLSADTARAIQSGHISRKAALNDALATQTIHIRDPGEHRAVRAHGGVGRKRVHATTTFLRSRSVSYIEQHSVCGRALTTLKITSSVDAFPCAGIGAKNTAGYPSGTDVRARLTANPAPLLIGTNEYLAGTGTWSHALAVTDDRRCAACARSWVYGRRSRESVYALESAEVSIGAVGSIVVWVFTVC